MRRIVSARGSVLRHEPGPRAPKALSDAMDGVVSALVETAPSLPSRPWALVALGGYGAGRLLPASDIDLLFLYQGTAAEVRPLVTAVTYALWDAGLDASQQVRRPKEHRAFCREDLETLTATLTGRAIAGDAALAERVLGECARDAARRKRKVLATLQARERTGTPYALEPDLKSGAGGRRDLDEVCWSAAVLLGRTGATLADAVEAGLLTPPELALLRSAEATLAEARWRLHTQLTRPTPVMTLEAAEEFAPLADKVQAALADVALVLPKVRARAAGSMPTQDSALTPDEFLGELERGREALDALAGRAWEGLLEDCAPGIKRLMTLRRPGLSHRYTVGYHSLATACAVADLAVSDPFAKQLPAAGAGRGPLLAAALAHDAGKEHAGSAHPEASVPRARETALALGLGTAAGNVAASLVRHHLLLADAATSKDLSDEDAVLEAAERLGDASLAVPLYVLTAADSLATAPGVWTPWRAALVRELVVKVEYALDPASDGVGLVAAARSARQAAMDLAYNRPDAGAVLETLRRAPRRWLASRTPQDALAQARMVAGFTRRDPVASLVQVEPGPGPGTHRVTLIALDRPGLFSIFAGALSISGLDILAAEAFTDPSGIALDTFVVHSDTLAQPDESTWRRLRRSLAAALVDRESLEKGLRERRRHYRRGNGRVRPGIDVSPGPFSTELRVTAPDRPGLLHDLALVVSERGLRIVTVTASTGAGAALDSFRVVDAAGEPPLDAEILGALSEGLLAASAGQ